MAKVGRPSKLTTETRKKLVDGIKVGATYELACGYAGIHYDTFNRWMKAGAKAQSGEFFEFYEAIKEAEGAAATGWLAKIEKAASNGHWQAAAWKLERRYPQDYGKQVHEHQNPDGTPIVQPIVDALVKIYGNG